MSRLHRYLFDERVAFVQKSFRDSKMMMSNASSEWKDLFSMIDNDGNDELDWEELANRFRKQAAITEEMLPMNELVEIFESICGDDAAGIQLETWMEFLGLEGEAAAAKKKAETERAEPIEHIFGLIHKYMVTTKQRPMDVFAKWSGDGFQLDKVEFSENIKKLNGGEVVKDEEIKYVFDELDDSGDGVLSQEEFLSEIRKIKRASAKAQAVSVAPSPMVAKKTVQRRAMDMPSKADRDEAFAQLDVNRVGALSFIELTKAVRLLFPSFDNNEALMRAYSATDTKGNGFLNKRDFRTLLECLIYFDSTWDTFQSIKDSLTAPPGGRMSVVDFKTHLNTCSVVITAGDIPDEYFDLVGEDDDTLAFEDFCTWVARRHQSVGIRAIMPPPCILVLIR